MSTYPNHEMPLTFELDGDIYSITEGELLNAREIVPTYTDAEIASAYGVWVGPAKCSDPT